ncbi:MAG: site-specific DNA-methyltransferase, partial [Nannocystaceae bacterium]
LRDVDRGMVPDTLWTRSQVGDNQDAQRELAALFGPVGRFPTPKPLRLAQRVLIMGSSPGDTVLDAFAGSGTTAHAALELQRGTDTAEAGPREPDGRRFVVVESGPSFAEVLVPRIEKAAYCGQWRDGEPVGGGGVPLCCRVLALESYDDALEGLRGSHEPLSRLLEPPAPEESLPPTAFAEPFDVRITLTRQGERRELAVSLVETFALLLGLRVETLGPLVQRGGTRARVMRGRDPAGQRVLVLWRTLDGTPAQQVEAAAARLRECLEGNAPPELVYVDGAHELDGAAWPRWRIEPIEATFRRRLWATD